MEVTIMYIFFCFQFHSLQWVPVQWLGFLTAVLGHSRVLEQVHILRMKRVDRKPVSGRPED